MEHNCYPKAKIFEGDSLSPIASRIIALFVITLAFLYIFPFFYLRDGCYIEIHDNLDGEFLYLHLLSKTGQAFNFQADAVIENIMNGLPRSLLRSGLNVTVLLFVLFDSLTAYIINDIIVHIIGFIGMYLLLTRYVIRDDENRHIAVFLSLCFALVKFYSADNGISVAGQPLLLLSFLNILNRRQRIRDYLFIVFFPFYSWIVLVAPFIITALLIIALFDAADKKKINYNFILWIFILCLTYVAVEFQMFYAIFFNHQITLHRIERLGVDYRSITFFSCLLDTLGHFFKTQLHTGTFYTFPIVLSTLVALSLMRYNLKSNPAFFKVLMSVLTIVLFWGFFPFFIYFPAKIIPKIQMVQWDRFYFLLPLGWFILFARSLLIILKRRNRYAVWFVYFLLITQLLSVIAANTRFLMNVHAVAYKTASKYIDLEHAAWFPKNKSPNFREFFAVKMFSQVRNYINKEQNSYWVVSIGMHPSIAQYNGFYTLDSYQSSYPLEYKRRFSTIIAPELEKNLRLKGYFYDWGNRAHVFSSELYDRCFLMCGKDIPAKITNLDINTAALKKMGGKYILSAVEITNYAKLNLHYEKFFHDKDSFWNIYLYRVL